MEDIKIYLAIISTAIAIFAATLYIKDISQHKTKPHIYSWFVSFCTIFIAATIQFTNGSWHQSLSLSVTFLLNTIILLLAFKFGTKNINNFDKSCLFFAIISLILFVSLKDKTLSLFMACLTDVFGMLPTIRKTYIEPYTETMSMYALAVIQYLLMITALDKVTFLNGGYPITIAILFSVFVIMIIWRRKILSRI